MSSGRQTRKDLTTVSSINTALLDAEEVSSSPPQSFRSISSGISTLFVARINQPVAPSASSKDPVVRVRKSGHLKRWLEEQRHVPTDGAEPTANDIPSSGTPCHPYLAYPHITWPTPVESLNDGASIADYVLVEDDKEMESEMLPTAQSRTTLSSRQESPRWTSSIRASARRGLRFSLPFSHRTAAVSKEEPPEIQRNSTAGLHHRDPIPFEFRPNDPSPLKYDHRHNSPNVSHFQGSYTQSNHTLTTVPTSFHHTNTITPPRLSVETMSSGRTDNSTPLHLNRIHSQVSNAFTSSSLGGSSYSVPPPRGVQRRSIFSANSSNSPSTIFSTSHSSPSAILHHDSSIASNRKMSTLTKKSSQLFRDIAQLSSTITLTKKKKLVVSGIHRNDYRALSGLQRWCESFGEVRQMTWAPNGDIHVDFKKSEVADSVCRIRAQVTIPGVGSVALSWYSGKKP